MKELKSRLCDDVLTEEGELDICEKRISKGRQTV